MNKKFIYLIQCRSKRLDEYRFLGERPESDVLFLTWDKRENETIYYPGSTWAEGRNHLLKEAKKISKEYDYYIFLDDDVEFECGGFAEFERMLLKYRPSVGLPVVPKSRGFRKMLSFLRLKPSKVQVATKIDEQMQAFSRAVINDCLALPYPTRFDEECWWYNTELHQMAIRCFYSHSVLQINTVVVKNDAHTNYPNNFSKIRFGRIIRQYFKGCSNFAVFFAFSVRFNLVWRFIMYNTYMFDIYDYFFGLKKSKEKKFSSSVLAVYRSRCLEYARKNK